MHKRTGLSSESAKNDAGQWLSKNGVGKELKGQTVDVRPFYDQLKGTNGYKIMVVKAAASIIQRRGGNPVIPWVEE